MRLNCINLVSTEPERLGSFYAMVLQEPYNEIVPGRSEILVGEVKLVFTRTSVQTPVNPDSCGLDAGWTDLPVVRQDQPDPGAASKQAAGPGRGGCADVGRRRFHPGIFSLW